MTSSAVNTLDGIIEGERRMFSVICGENGPNSFTE